MPAHDQGAASSPRSAGPCRTGRPGWPCTPALGLLLLAGSVVPLIRAVAARRPAFIVASEFSLLAILGAAASGAAFVNTGANSASLGMALLAAVALLCQLVNLFLLASTRPARG